jgi:hypothetical protein
MRPLRLIAAVIAGVLAAGCSSTPAPALLALRPVAGGRGFAQRFPRAYFSQADDGDREVVLIDDGYTAAPAPAAGPLQPVATTPLQQFMSFKILWSPLHGTRSDAPSATNALIDWTIRASRPGRADDYMHYQGAGFVLVDGDSQFLTLDIRNASLEPTQHSGGLSDPLGPCTISGRFTAARDDGLVQATLTDLRSFAIIDRAQTAGMTSADMPNPPARLQTP